VLRVKVTDDFLRVTLSARAAFSKRSWPFVVATAVSWLLCSGQRSVRRLASLGAFRRSTSAYYRFLSDGKWRLDVLSRALFDLIIRKFAIQELTLVLDDTLCPKWGRKIYGTGTYFDHTARPRSGFIWGHNWVVMAIVIGVGSKASRALPFWIGLYRQKDRCSPGQFRTRHQMAVRVLHLVRAWFPGPIRLLADGAYANSSLVGPAKELGIELISRLRTDAGLRAPVPELRATKARGRQPKHGKRLGKLRSMARRTSSFRSERVAIYGKAVELLVREFDAYWPALHRVVRVVITRDPRRPRRVAYLLSTDLGLGAVQIIEGFAKRWSIEQLFSVAKNQMGLDSGEVRKERAVVRHAAFCMALITWTEVWSWVRQPARWGRPFAANLAALRDATIKETIFASGPRARGSRRIARGLGFLFTSATAAA
jgi:hypothetical protein